jgi:ATPase subunit of ABC transporter with duplicated ATPase domains
VGLVGPNGAGKSTIFRLIVGDEAPDEGVVSRPKLMTIGYFRQDVGDMRGRTVLAETVAGAGPVAELGAELVKLEEKMATGDDLDDVLERYGEVQQRFTDLGGYDLEARAAAILAGLGLAAEQVSGRRGAPLGRLEDAGGPRPHPAGSGPSVLLLDEPTNYLDIESILWLEDFLRAYPGAVLMTCHDRDVMNRVVYRIVEIDGGSDHQLLGQLRLLRAQRALRPPARRPSTPASRPCSRRRCGSSSASRPRRPRRLRCRAGHQDARQDRAVEPPRRAVERYFDFRPPARSGDDVIKIKGLAQGLRRRTMHGGLDLVVRRGERWAVMGENGAGKSTS